MKDAYSLIRSIIKTSARLRDKPVLLPERINIVINVQTHAQAKCRQQESVHMEGGGDPGYYEVYFSDSH